MRGAKAETMADLLRQAGYGWILNGTTPSSSDAHSTFRKDHRKTQEKRHRKRHKMLEDEAQSYVVLVPTDAAFTRINLTYYLNNPAALEALVQLHIIPSPADEVLPSGSAPQLPLALSDKSSFRSLLDSRLGGRSKYGELAFRQTHESGEDNLGWAVGIKGARGTDGKHDSARVLAFGRESIGSDRASLSKSTDDDNDVDAPPRSVGGVLTLDAVLLPYRPSWFYRWGWILLVCFGVGFVLAGIGWGCWVWWRRKDGRIRLPDAMDGEWCLPPLLFSSIPFICSHL